MQIFTKNKENEQVQIVAKHLYESFQNVQSTYDPNKYDYLHGAAYLFDDCFADDEWRRDTKLLDFISYPRMYGLTTVFGFQHLPDLPSRMYWNLDLICIGTTTDREKIYDTFFLYLLSYETFCKLLDTYTKENGFLVLRREGTEDRIYVCT